MSRQPRARVNRLLRILFSAVDGPLSPSVARSAGRAIAYGSVVWHEMQNVPLSRAAFDHVDHHSARLSRYFAAAFASHPVTSDSTAACVAAIPTTHAITSPDITIARVCLAID